MTRMEAVEARELTVGNRIRWARRRAGLSQDKLATLIGTTRQVVIRWEKDRHLPNLQSRERLGEATGQHPDFFRDETRHAPHDEDDEAMERRARELVAPFQRDDDRGAARGLPSARGSEEPESASG